MSHRMDLGGSSPSEERFISLESHVAELERLADELNKILVEHGRTIRRLQSQQAEISTQLKTLELERIRSHNPKPPHSAV